MHIKQMPTALQWNRPFTVAWAMRFATALDARWTFNTALDATTAFDARSYVGSSFTYIYQVLDIESCWSQTSLMLCLGDRMVAARTFGSRGGTPPLNARSHLIFSWCWSRRRPDAVVEVQPRACLTTMRSRLLALPCSTCMQDVRNNLLSFPK